MVIYKVTNNVNGKVYIGKTIKSISIRWKQHLSKARQAKSRYLLHHAIAKYGPENFKIEIIDTANTINELLEKERAYIKLYNTFNNPKIGYNMTMGGDDGELDDDATKRKLEAMRTPQYRERVSKQFTGYKWSAETIAKRACALRGKTRTPEQKERMRLAKLGRKLSEEHKQKISQSLKQTLNTIIHV